MARRRFLQGALATGLLPLPSAKAAASPRIATLDYGLANTLLSLGVTPIAVAAAEGWSDWVVEPPLPSEVVDLGVDREINLELLAALSPDLILTTPYVQSLRSRLEEIAPVLSFSVYNENKRPFRQAQEATLRLAERLGREAEGRALLDRAETLFAALSVRLHVSDPGPLLLVRFMDARHVRVYGGGSLFQDVMDRLGLRNAWEGPATLWGFETVGVEQLAPAAGPETEIFTFEPVPQEVLPTLGNSPLWRRLPAVEAGNFSILPAVLMFGMVPSAMRFADVVSRALLESRA
ncbi:MAG TPA: ABC transporter substrate-binding protein [Kiloniellales bacterium]|nr:ABC transporter substrate-binding protein [Kiloniellales bacterium]